MLRKGEIRGLNRRGIGGGGVVTPLSILGTTGLTWLRADLGIELNGSNVSAWADQSGNGHNLSQGTAARQPAWSATSGKNSLAGITFDGAAAPNNDFLRGAWAWNQPAHIWIVAKCSTAPAVNDTLCDGAAGNNGPRIFFNAGGTIATFYMGGASNLTRNVTATNWNFYEAAADGAGQGRFAVNGGAAATGAIGAGNPGGLILTAFGDQSSAPLDCVVCEVIAKEAVQDATKIAAISAYLVARYGAF